MGLAFLVNAIYVKITKCICHQGNLVLLNSLPPSSIHLHPPPPSLFQPPSSSSSSSKTKILQVIGQFPKFRLKNWKLFILTEKYCKQYFGGANSESKLRFFNSDPKIHFWANLGRKNQSCPFCLKIGTQSISRMLILIPN